MLTSLIDLIAVPSLIACYLPNSPLKSTSSQQQVYIIYKQSLYFLLTLCNKSTNSLYNTENLLENLIKNFVKND